jgi:undecaprenyl diphosphate synthase
VPEHVAIIMDGNGRWAASRGLPRLAGHEAGTANIRRITEAAGAMGIRYLTLWAFSTENWSRPPEEVSGIVRILGEAIDRELAELHRQGAQLRHIGSLEGLSPEMREAVLGAIELTRDNNRLVLTLAFDYGGRQELLTAIRRIVAAGIPPDEIDEATIERHLFTSDLPDPDLIIRTSGEYPAARQRLFEPLAGTSNPVVLGGDVHSFNASQLKLDFDDAASPVVASEFVTSSITSQAWSQERLDRYLPDNPHLLLADSRFRGYARAEVSARRMQVDLRAMQSVQTRDAACSTLASFVVEDGRPGPVRATA